ncbi:MAG: hybrid sensor histidine kinase/response regulator [Rhodocyclales bacterium]|nr:hybrid sensor histidine kinase/response regulator [Rhodocyclales bacterium]
MLLGILGYNVEVAYDGVTGLQATALFVPDIIICDIGLPGLDGYGVATAIRSNAATSAVPMIALTAYGEEVQDKIMQSGFALHLVKPADLGVLRSALSVLTQE